jgi:hypothetical protein
MTKKYKHVDITVKPEVHKAFQRLVRDQGTNVSAVLNSFMEFYVSAEKEKQDDKKSL